MERKVLRRWNGSCAVVEYAAEKPDTMPVATWEKQKKIHNEQCPVCLEDFEGGERVWRSPCGHGAHEDCFGDYCKPYLDKNDPKYQYDYAKCPLCRDPFDPDEKKAVVQRLSEERGLDPTGRIEELISQNKVMLFIKGTKAFPQCGFSNTVVRLIEDCTDDFETFDVLSDETVREGIKEYSSWPTIPQIYLGGEFIGGADIAIEMHESGELKDAVAEALAKPVEGGKNEPVWNFAQDNLSG